MQLSNFLPPELNKLDKKHKGYKFSESVAKQLSTDSDEVSLSKKEKHHKKNKKNRW